MNPNRALFLRFSEEITGYSSIELEGTGMVDTYQAVLEQALTAAILSNLYQAATAVVTPTDAVERENVMRAQVLPSVILWPIVSNLISLWYLGTWIALPDPWYPAGGMKKPSPGDPGSPFQPSEDAWIQQLSYRTAGAHTPGANPTGYGSWSIPPVF